jgi:hypothetical protein
MSIKNTFNPLAIFAVLKDVLLRGKFIYPAILSLSLIAVLYYISLIPIGASHTEVDFYYSSSSLSEIFANPLSLPYKLVNFFLTQLSPSIRTARALSVIVFGVSVFSLYKILKRWHNSKIALFSAVLFGTNATVLSIARLGTPLVLLLSWSVILSILVWLQYGKSRKIAPVGLAIVGALLFYIPGAPYFYLLLVVLFANKHKSFFLSIQKQALYFGIFLGILAVSPLIYRVVTDSVVLREWLLIPQSVDWGSIPRNILRVPSAFIYRAPGDALINVGRLPIFDVASGGLFLLGLYGYYKNYKLERVRIMLLSALFAIVLGALGQVTAGFIIVIPFAYAVVAAGISLLLEEWYKIFPNNPFARSFGIIAIVVMLSFSVYYQLNRFLIVWPQTPETRQEYNQPRLLQ